MLVGDFLEQAITRFAWEFQRNSYYLPAARSGILQSHKALASSVVRQSSLAGIEPLEVPQLTGVITDFIGHLLSLHPRRGRPRALQQVASFLESEVIAGKISMQGGSKVDYPEFFHRTQATRFALHRTSSMVSEMAPIILLIRHLVERGELLIIEEPESHLHPAAQRRLVQALARLRSEKVSLLLTTHSDYFLQQLSNLLRLGALSAERKDRLGYNEKEAIPSNSVGAYLFDTKGEQPGSVIQELEVTDRDGIPEDAFVDVAEALYDEMVGLERAVTRDESTD